MNKYNEYESVYEDDRNIIPDCVFSMSPEEREAEEQRLFREMKGHPCKKKKPACSVQFNI